MNKAESVVAVVPGVTVLNEQELSEEVTDIELRAANFLIKTESDYAEAGEFGKLLKRKAVEVTTFFKPMKDSAHQAHKAICDREKEMLNPLKNAEKMVKKAMGDYLMELDRKRREAEEAMRRAAEAEMQRKLEEAAKLECSGNQEQAEAAFEDAAIMEESAVSAFASPDKPKVSGVSATKDWQITCVNAAAVPVVFNGMELRPVDQAAVMRLIRASKGKIEIPGITYQEVSKMSFRR